MDTHFAFPELSQPKIAQFGSDILNTYYYLCLFLEIKKIIVKTLSKNKKIKIRGSTPT